MVTMNVSVDDELARELAALARKQGSSAEELVVGAARALIEQHKYQAAIDEGIEDADRGDLVDADEVFRSLRTKLEGMRAQK
jgi:predicted transcriptional regulator